jgi:hypothetical protein
MSVEEKQVQLTALVLAVAATSLPVNDISIVYPLTEGGSASLNNCQQTVLYMVDADHLDDYYLDKEIAR